MARLARRQIQICFGASFFAGIVRLLVVEVMQWFVDSSWPTAWDCSKALRLCRMCGHNLDRKRLSGSSAELQTWCWKWDLASYKLLTCVKYPSWLVNFELWLLFTSGAGEIWSPEPTMKYSLNKGCKEEKCHNQVNIQPVSSDALFRGEHYLAILASHAS